MGFRLQSLGRRGDGNDDPYTCRVFITALGRRVIHADYALAVSRGLSEQSNIGETGDIKRFIGVLNLFTTSP